MYEQSLLHPLGKEWNAVKAHQKAIRPVTSIKGAIIEAITYHDSGKERREAERRDENK